MTTLPKEGTYLRAVLDTICEEPGIFGMAVARKLKPVDDDPETYGTQRPTSSAIAELRERGLIEDVAERCIHCGCAQTRKNRNVELRPTALALKLKGMAA